MIEAGAMRMLEAGQEAMPAATPSGRVIYYRHPDGDPAYSPIPRKTDDGRDFVAVRASEDVGFDEAAKAAPEMAAAASPADPVVYYRHPDGDPAYSLAPKETEDGRDFMPVRAGEDVSFDETAKAAPDMAAGTIRPERLGRTANPLLPQPDGPCGHFADAEELDGDGLHPRLRGRAGRLDHREFGRQAAAHRGQDRARHQACHRRQVRVPGTVTLDERRVTVVAPRTEIFIEEVAEVTTGEAIEKGRPLVRFFAREIAAAGALYAADLKSGAGNGAAGGSLQRLENLGVPAEAIAEIEQTRKVPISVTLTAPRDGVVLERNAIEGMKAAPGDVLFRLADTSTMWVLADVPEYDLGMVLPGASATIRVRSLPGRTFSGRVGVIYPQVSSATRTARVRVEIANPDGLSAAGHVCRRRDRDRGCQARRDRARQRRHRHRYAAGGDCRQGRRPFRAARGQDRRGAGGAHRDHGRRRRGRQRRRRGELPDRRRKQSEGGARGSTTGEAGQ